MTIDSALEGKTAIVTGASAGIGRATALALADEGANIVLAARRTDRLDAIAIEIDQERESQSLVCQTDVSVEADVGSMVDDAIDTFGTIDVVVNNAGTGTERGVSVESLPTEQYRTVMDVNTDGMFFTARETLPYLRESKGNLIFVGSFAGHHPRPHNPVYAATKWWTRGFALSLAGQVGDDDIGVAVVNPSEVRTEFGKDYRTQEEFIKERYDPGEVTEPEEVAEAIVFAARQEPPNATTEIELYRRDKFSGF